MVLPRELLARLRVSKGDTLHALATPDGVELTPHDPAVADQIEMAEALLREDRDVLKKPGE